MRLGAIISEKNLDSLALIIRIKNNTSNGDK